MPVSSRCPRLFGGDDRIEVFQSPLFVLLMILIQKYCLMEASDNFDDLVKLVKTLREECPWDRKQTHESLKDHLIEETYETIEAIDDQNFEELKKELGDVLLQVVFHSIMGEEKEQFDMGDVIKTIQQKMIRRHPHVFGDVKADDSEKVSENWEHIKMNEGKESVLEGLLVQGMQGKGFLRPITRWSCKALSRPLLVLVPFKQLVRWSWIPFQDHQDHLKLRPACFL